MPSNYCRGSNQFSVECIRNPNYEPSSLPTWGSSPFPSSGSSTLPPDWSPIVFDSQGRVKVQSTQGGVNISQNVTTLDKILNSVLTLATIAKGRDYIPTTEQPQNQYSQYPLGYNPYTPSIDGQDTASGKIEAWMKNNTGVVLIVAAIGGAYLLKSPRQRK